MHAHRLALDPELSYVAVIPDRPLETKIARGAIPDRISHQDAVFNLGRMGQMIAGMADHRQFSPGASDDRLHQRYRESLFPESGDLLRALSNAGALASFWSGAGPTLLGVCHVSIVHSVRDAAAEAMAERELAGNAIVLSADVDGLVVLE